MFGITKFSSQSLQYDLKLFINNEIVPTVKSGELFKYLGHYFNFEMDNEVLKEKLNSISDISNRINAVSDLPKNNNFYTSVITFQNYLGTSQ